MAKKSGSISTGSLEVVKKVASLDRNAIKQGINEIFHHDTFHQKYKVRFHSTFCSVLWKYGIPKKASCREKYFEIP